MRRRRRARPRRPRVSTCSSSTSWIRPMRCCCSRSSATLGLAADRAYGGRSAKKQFAAADRSGAMWAVIVGAREAEQGVVAVRDLRSGEQTEVKRTEIASWLAARKVRKSDMMRSHRAGELRADRCRRHPLRSAAGSRTARDHGGKVFLDLRDAAGIVQVVVDPQQPGLDVVHHIRGEWVVRVTGEVAPRPDGTVNPELPTGEIEVARRFDRGAQRGRAAAVPARRPRRRRRDPAAAVPVPRPPARADAAEPADPRRGEPGDARGDGRAGTSSRSRRRC